MRWLDSVTDQMDMNLSKLGASPVAWLVKNLPAMQESWVRFLGREDPLEKEIPVFLLEESHEQKSLAG